MMPQSLEDRIKERAYEIYQARMETGQHIIIDKEGDEKEITAEDDYCQAKDEIIREEKKKW